MKTAFEDHADSGEFCPHCVKHGANEALEEALKILEAASKEIRALKIP